MSQYVTKIRTNQGDKQIDYNALANLPTISNPNLLINGDFRINQRGADSYGQVNQWTYSVDRWKYIGLMTVTKNASGTVTLSKTNNSEFTYFAQTPEHINGRAGVYTFSFKVKSISGALSAYLDRGDSEILTVTSAGVYHVTSNAYADSVIFRLDDTNTSVELEWAKLEVGNTATAFSPRPYGEELELCKRYFSIMCGVRASGVEQDYATNMFMYVIPRHGIMRVTPTISIHGTTTTNSTDGICVRTIGCAIMPGFTFQYEVRSWELIIKAYSSTPLDKMCYDTQLYMNDAFKIYLDAEIY